jgi:hypothetical protein
LARFAFAYQLVSAVLVWHVVSILVDPYATRRRIEALERRIERADEHCAALDTAIQSFMRGENRTVPRKSYPDFGQETPEPYINPGLFRQGEGVQAWSIQQDWFAEGRHNPLQAGDEIVLRLKMHDPGIDIEWGTILGDWTHCLRATLDNMAWSATVIFQSVLGRKPPQRPFPKDSPWGDVAFPVVMDETRWTAAANKRLWGVGPSVRALFKDFQPFAHREDIPLKAHPFYLLQELSNIDKHQGINFLATKGFIEPIQVPDGVIYTPKDAWALHHYAEVGRLRLLTEEAARGYPEEMDMHLGASFEIAFGKGNPAEGRPVGKTMRWIRADISSLLVFTARRWKHEDFWTGTM